MKGSIVDLLGRFAIEIGVAGDHSLTSRLLRLAGLVLGLTILVACFFYLLVWSGAFGRIPSRNDLRSINHRVATEIYSADSVLLGKYFLEERTPVLSSQIPVSLKEALIATEDIRFFKHNGVDKRSMLRVIIKGIILRRESAGGGSTLTQQLAKNLYPRQSYAWLSLPINKVREIILSKRLESIYSKDEILTMYLNTIPFGDNVYGIQSAADRFFSVSVDQLTLTQSAMLVGMLKATHRYNPRLFPDRAKERRDVVLSQLAKYDFISDSRKDSLVSAPLELKYHRVSHNTGLAPYFRAYLKGELLSWCKSHVKGDGSPYNLYTDGLKIYTTIDSRMQRYAEASVRSQMTRLQRTFGQQIDKKKVQDLAKAKVSQLSQYQYLKGEGLTENEIMAELKKLGPRRVFAWEGDRELKISTYDSLIRHLQFLQTGFLAKDPSNGHVKAWVGGIDHEFFQFDHVRESTKRQVGSTFKPIVYAAAMEQGIKPCDYTSARKTSYSNMDDWTPQNSEEKTYDQKFSMEGGLALSVNTVSVKLLEKTGISEATAVANRMGIKSNLPQVPSLALGSASISISEMVDAYSVFANHGKYVSPRVITSITSSSGEALERMTEASVSEEAISEETAAMMLYMLKRVVNEGTGASLRTLYGLRNDIAGKTGTTQANADGWFIGITPKLVIGCWVGADDPGIHFKTTAAGQGAATALPIVARFLQQVNKDEELIAIARARFEPLERRLMEKLDCDLSRSDRNLLQRIFNIRRGTKESRFKVDKKNNTP